MSSISLLLLLFLTSAPTLGLLDVICFICQRAPSWLKIIATTRPSLTPSLGRLRSLADEVMHGNNLEILDELLYLPRRTSHYLALPLPTSPYLSLT